MVPYSAVVFRGEEFPISQWNRLKLNTLVSFLVKVLLLAGGKQKCHPVVLSVESHFFFFFKYVTAAHDESEMSWRPTGATWAANCSGSQVQLSRGFPRSPSHHVIKHIFCLRIKHFFVCHATACPFKFQSVSILVGGVSMQMYIIQLCNSSIS